MLRLNSATKNLLLTFLSWSKVGKSAKQTLHGVYLRLPKGFSMTTANSAASKDAFSLAPLRPFDFAQDMLCGRYSELGCGFAMPSPL
jgi:hypothetical protein